MDFLIIFKFVGMPLRSFLRLHVYLRDQSVLVVKSCFPSVILVAKSFI